MSDLYLIAHVINGHSTEAAEIEFEVAYCIGDEWFTNDHRRIWPFWTDPLPTPSLSIPHGWLEYLRNEADHYAATHASRSLDISALLAPAVAKPQRRF